MLFLLHLAILLLSFSCKAEVNKTYSTGLQDKAFLTDVNGTFNILGLNWSDTTNVTSSFNIASQSVNQELYTPGYSRMTTILKMAAESTKMKTTMQKKASENTKTTMQTVASESTKMTPYTTTKKPFGFTNRYAGNHSTNTPCVCKDDRYKTGIMICAIIIAVLVLICAALIICSVALANKVSSLKTKLTQSKRQARSNGDFLSASSILWPSGMETWQKKSQTANQTMDEISLGETNSNDEKHKLMTVQTIEKIKDPTEDKKTSSNDEIMTIVSTVEV
ncbi:protein EVI2A [Aquarana catesbeiana]|uniref:protein EVI2A n=1 Tax=Aquarana catesbeiana TaxID=8400 RepID=UPI003CC9A174